MKRLVDAGADVLRVQAERSPLNSLHLQLNGLLHAHHLLLLHEEQRVRLVVKVDNLLLIRLL